MGALFAAFILCIVFPSAFQTSVAINIPLNSILPTELVNNNSTSNVSSTGETSNVFTQCSASVVSWLGFEKPVPNAFVDNCKAADDLLQADIHKYGSTRLEFVPRRGRGMYGLEVMRTPLKYTAGTYKLPSLFPSLVPSSPKVPGTTFACTITVVNMNVVPQRYVRPARFRGTDVATFYDVRNALAEIWRICLYGPPERQVGYAVTGMLILPKRMRRCVQAADDRRRG